MHCLDWCDSYYSWKLLFTTNCTKRTNGKYFSSFNDALSGFVRFVLFVVVIIYHELHESHE
jgi:hypothetical protein